MEATVGIGNLLWDNSLTMLKRLSGCGKRFGVRQDLRTPAPGYASIPRRLLHDKEL